MMLGWCCYPKLEVQVEEKFWNGGFFTFGVWGPCVPAQSLRSCVTLCDPRDCSPPGSSVHGILQARILQWVAMPSSRGSSWPRDWSHVSASPALQVDILPTEPPGKPEFEVPEGKSSGKIYQEVKGWDLNLKSGLKYPSCYWQRSSHWSYNIVKRKIERKQESDLWGYTHLSTPWSLRTTGFVSIVSVTHRSCTVV